MAFGADDAALVGAAATVIGAGTSAVAQSSLNKKTREFNKEEAEKQRLWSEKMYNAQNAWNYEMWLKQNEYNTPEAQIQRMRDAGLNPLFYGLDGSSAGDLSSAQPLGYERADAGNQVNPFAGFGDVATKVAQIANINADTAKKEGETATEIERRNNLIKERDEMEARIKNYEASTKLTDKEREKIETYQEFAREIYQADIDAKNAAKALSESQKKRIDELLEGEKEIQKMSIEDFRKKWNYWNAQIGHMAHQDALLAKQSKYYLISLLTSGFQGTGASGVNALIMKYILSDPDLTQEEKDAIVPAFTGGNTYEGSHDANKHSSSDSDDLNEFFRSGQ